MWMKSPPINSKLVDEPITIHCIFVLSGRNSSLNQTLKLSAIQLFQATNGEGDSHLTNKTKQKRWKQCNDFIRCQATARTSDWHVVGKGCDERNNTPRMKVLILGGLWPQQSDSAVACLGHVAQHCRASDFRSKLSLQTPETASQTEADYLHLSYVPCWSQQLITSASLITKISCLGAWVLWCA